MYCLGGGIKNQKYNEKMVTGVLGEAGAGARPARAQLQAWPFELSLEEQGLYNQNQWEGHSCWQSSKNKTGACITQRGDLLPWNGVQVQGHWGHSPS